MDGSPSSARDTPAALDGGPGSSPVAVVFVSHSLHGSVLGRFEKLVRETPPRGDVYFLFDATDADDAERRRVRAAAGERLRTFDRARVTDVDFPDPWADSTRQELLPGNLGLLYLHLSRREPDYERYWFVHYDVAFTGSWTDLFRAFERSPADVLGTTLQPYDRQPDWYWWPSFEPAPDLDRSEWRRGFFPLVRLSRDALDRLAGAYRAGWSGHFEAVMPTVARYHGLELEDVGGDGPYVEPGNTDRFYTNTRDRDSLAPGTFVYRPARPRPGSRPGTLWHPVKPHQGAVRPYVRLARQWAAARLPGR